MYRQGDRVWAEINGEWQIAEFRRFTDEPTYCIVEVTNALGFVYSYRVPVASIFLYERDHKYG